MKRTTAILLVLCASISLLAQERFCIAKAGKAATILVDENDWKGVIRAAHDLGDDVKKVTGTAAEVVESNSLTSHILPLTSIYVGTIGKSRIIDRLIKQKKLDVKIIKGRWEAYKICVVDGNLLIAGSDKRGTIYGIYELSRRMGVSPWYWMADAPVIHKDEVWYHGYGHDYEWPAVKYRGIFINDDPVQDAYGIACRQTYYCNCRQSGCNNFFHKSIYIPV